MDFIAALPILLGVACLAFLGPSIVALLAAYHLSKPFDYSSSTPEERLQRTYIVAYLWHHHLPPFNYPEMNHAHSALHPHNPACPPSNLLSPANVPPPPHKFPSYNPNSSTNCPPGLPHPGMGPISKPGFQPPIPSFNPPGSHHPGGMRPANQPSFPKPPTIPMYKPSPPIIPPFSQPGLLRPPGMGPVQPPGQPPFPAGPRFHK